MTSIFPEIFEPPSIATNGRFGFVERIAEVVELLLHEETGHRRREVLGDAGGAGVRAMRRAERVVHVEVAELGERAGQALVVRLLTAEKARVLEQQDSRPASGRSSP